MIYPPIWGWYITPGEIKTKIINFICIAIIGTILILYKNWYKNN